jgi:hypothetical protein
MPITDTALGVIGVRSSSRVSAAALGVDRDFSGRRFDSFSTAEILDFAGCESPGRLVMPN